MYTMRIIIWLCAALALSPLKVWAQLTQPLTPSENQLLEYLVGRCNAPPPPLSAFPIGFEHPMDVIACEVAERYRKQSDINYMLYSRGFHINSKEIAQEFAERNERLGITYFNSTNQDNSIQIVLDGAKRGEPNLLSMVLSHPERHEISEQDLDELTKYFPRYFLRLLLEDLTQFDLSAIVDRITPVVHNLNKFSPQTLEALHPWVLNGLIANKDRWPLYQEILALDSDRKLILLSYLSTLDFDSTKATEFPSIKRLLQISLWSSRAIATGWTFDNRLETTDARSYHPLVNYLEALSRIDAHFKFDPSYISLIPTIQYVKTTREQYPAVYQFDKFFLSGVHFIESIPTNFTNKFGPILSLDEEPKELWEKNLLEAEATLRVLSGFNVNGINKSFTDEDKKVYWELFVKYANRAPEFQRFFLEANALAASASRDQHGLSNTSRNQQFQDFLKFYDPILAKGCPLQSETQCLKFWTSFPRQSFLGGVINYLTDFNCTVPENIKNLAIQAADHLLFPQRFVAHCDLSSLANLTIKSKPEQRLRENLWKILAYPEPIGGTFWGGARIFINENFGVLASHLLNRSEKVNYSISRDSYLVGYGADQTGWSYLLNLAETPFPPSPTELKDKLGTRLTSTLPDYASLQSAVGNVDKAFAGYYSTVANAEAFYATSPKVNLANLYFLGRSAGIPPAYLLTHINKYQPKSDKEARSPLGQLLDQFYDSYLQISKPLPLIPTIQSLTGQNDLPAYQKAARIQGQLWSAPSKVKEFGCSIPEVRDYVLDTGEKFPVRTPYDTSVYGGIFAYYELGNVDSICRTTEIRNQLISDGINQSLLDSYDRFLKDSINPFVLGGMNVSDVRYLVSMVAFAEAAMYADREFGAILSLAVIKNIYLKLSKAYVNRNSDTLRYAQSKLEKALVAIGTVVLEARLRRGGDSLDSVTESWMALSLSAKHPLLNDQVKQRLLDNSNEFFSKQVVAHNEAVRGLRTSISNSSSIFDYMQHVASFSENAIDELPHYPFIAARHFTYYNRSNPSFDDISLQFVSLSSSGSLVSVLGVRHSREYFGDIIPATQSLEPFVRQIKENGAVTDEIERSLCVTLAPIHEYLDKVLKLSDEETPVFISPSVNLFPIPPELIMGTGCKGHDTPLILVNDFSGAISAYRKLNQKKIPDRLIAMANPMIEGDSFEGLISDIRGHRFGTTRSIDTDVISNLPPLPDAELEVDRISKLFPSSELLFGPNASISKTLDRVQASPNSLLLLATHGLPVDPNIESETPALLSIEDEELGLVSSMDIYKYDLRGSTVMLSACDTAAGFVDDSSLMFTGFVKSFADTGADIIFASLWPVKSYASRAFSESLFSSWSETESLVESLASAKREVGGLDKYPFVMISP